MDKDTLDALRFTWESSQARNVILQAKLDALVFTITARCGTDYDEFMRFLKLATEKILDQKLIELEDRNPSFAARFRAAVDGEIPNFPMDAYPDRDAGSEPKT